jgi:hypothetical protein
VSTIALSCHNGESCIAASSLAESASCSIGTA